MRQIMTHGGALVAALHDEKTGSGQYTVSDPDTGVAAITDPVWDFSAAAYMSAQLHLTNPVQLMVVSFVVSRPSSGQKRSWRSESS